MIYQQFRYRIRPSKNQRTKLMKTLELCRWVYNETLMVRKSKWETEQVSISLYDTNKLLTSWKISHPELTSANAQVLQNVQARVDFAFNAFFRRVKVGEKPGYPRFKGDGRYSSFTYPQAKGNWKFIGDRILHISKIGDAKIIMHRPMKGTAKTLTISRDAVGNWYACFVCECDPERFPTNSLAIGIDMGIESFATTSNGVKVENPRFFRRDEKELTKAQRRLSKADSYTSERLNGRKTVQHIHQRIANRRKDFAHKVSRDLVNNFGLVVFEKLTVRNMIQNHSLAKSISDAAWKQLIQYTMYKAEYAGRVVVLVDPRNTSKMCSCCGTMVEKSLDVRVHDCPACGLVIDRDQNAAINILGLGLQSLGWPLEAPADWRGE